MWRMSKVEQNSRSLDNSMQTLTLTHADQSRLSLYNALIFCDLNLFQQHSYFIKDRCWWTGFIFFAEWDNLQHVCLIWGHFLLLSGELLCKKENVAVWSFNKRNI